MLEATIFTEREREKEKWNWSALSNAEASLEIYIWCAEKLMGSCQEDKKPVWKGSYYPKFGHYKHQNNDNN